jgi:hypothetical protein
MQGSRRRVDSHCLLTAHMVGEILLKLLYLWAGRQSARTQGLHHRLDRGLTDVWHSEWHDPLMHRLILSV